MQNFDIIKKSDIEKTYRVKAILDTYDLQVSEISEQFTGQFDLSFDWNVGLIVGNSGTGKSTISQQVFGSFFTPEYTHKSIIDDFDKKHSVKEIVDTLNAVGFSSIPNYLKPYNVLSNGEKMRVDLAKALLSEKEIIVFDEFTSVVDRNIAQIMSYNVQKNIRRFNRKFIAVSCHFDIEPWLNPDWVFDTNSMTFHRCEKQKKNRPERELRIYEIRENKTYYWDIFKKYHYLSHYFNAASRIFIATYNGYICSFSACLRFPNRSKKIKYYRDHRTVVLPDFQGLNIGLIMAEFIGEMLKKEGYVYLCTTSNPARIKQLNRSSKFICTRIGRVKEGKGNLFGVSNRRITASFRYI